MERRPLVERLVEFKKNNPISFHVPGHKSGLLSGLPTFVKPMLSIDVTELTGLDDLHHPEEVILEAEQLLAKTYEADQSYFLVNGSTVGNMAMILASCSRGDIVLVQRNAHKSVFNALEMANVTPVFLSPEWDQRTQTATHITLHTLQEAIRMYPSAKAVVFTTPTYYGVVANKLEELVQVCHDANMTVLVDEAHGAHFRAAKDFPVSALDAGADVVVQSAHKTLPAMTMGSFLHVREGRVSSTKLQWYLRALQSSSPSYVIMASLDDARAFVAEYTERDMRHFLTVRSSFVESLQGIPSIEVVEVDDPLKLLLRIKGHTGYYLQQALESAGIFTELADTTQVLMVLPLVKSNTPFSFAEVRKRIKRVAEICNKAPRTEHLIEWSVPDNKIFANACSYERLHELEVESITYTKCIGRISAGDVIPYPPGIPLLVRGEKITTTQLKAIADYLAIEATIQGQHRLNDRQLLVLKGE
ncbi:aminotransferase class I/II-fold pyridoxal phosphate-dependent enzyme [Paenisporosarcina cavernae]|uniref:Aminotransferase class I/II-fold pyridoxal phosphate-dependent enzyme n=1 Tax=Paenisporosarcina cavernae TaxID=2320858 RepID=A0A385YYI9_9BACL|nr:aminotransferase class I/II-fold pyridoxal phosphate-dependent enzyme [Paenisporosarcina cavernae]AYC30718.1 aminotransferase class I/II-fold pyridoxal phosphate-dependent enzyme [Paenisporosarcina cavernae]